MTVAVTLQTAIGSSGQFEGEHEEILGHRRSGTRQLPAQVLTVTANRLRDVLDLGVGHFWANHVRSEENLR